MAVRRDDGSIILAVVCGLNLRWSEIEIVSIAFRESKSSEDAEYTRGTQQRDLCRRSFSLMVMCL